MSKPLPFYVPFLREKVPLSYTFRRKFYPFHIPTERDFLTFHLKGFEWSLRAFASTRALRLFLRARAVINFVLRAASTLENTSSEQRTLHKFSANFTPRLIRVLLVP